MAEPRVGRHRARFGDRRGLIAALPRFTPVVWRTLERVFVAVGFRFARQEGSHRSYVREGVSRPIVIPTYAEVPVFIIRNNLKTAGLSRDDYFRLLEQVH
jgi:predicted RNA binding protein YcfA (HicA-like mRNA interferase family)